MAIFKKRFTTLFLGFILLFPFLFTPVYAADNAINGSVILEKNTIVNHDYFASGNSVSLHGTVNGDVYLFGGTINVDGVVNGDLFAFGGTVNIGGEIKNDLRVAGGTVVVNGKVGGNILSGGGTVTFSKDSNITGSLIAGGGEITLDTPISKTVWLGSGQIIINSNLKSDVNIGGGNITLDSDAQVGGNLNYWSDSQIKILQGASVSGVVTQNQPNQAIEKDRLHPFFSGFGFIVKLVSTLNLIIIGLLLLHFLPKKTLLVSLEIEKKPLASLGWGIGLIIILGVLSFILTVSLFGLPLGLLLGLGTLIGLYLATIFVSLWLGRKLFTSLDRPNRYNWALIVGVILFEVISLLPFVGTLLKVIGIVISFGALLRVERDTYLELKAKL